VSNGKKAKQTSEEALSGFRAILRVNSPTVRKSCTRVYARVAERKNQGLLRSLQAAAAGVDSMSYASTWPIYMSLIEHRSYLLKGCVDRRISGLTNFCTAKISRREMLYRLSYAKVVCSRTCLHKRLLLLTVNFYLQLVGRQGRRHSSDTM
jgi:hypothetical protein